MTNLLVPGAEVQFLTVKYTSLLADELLIFGVYMARTTCPTVWYSHIKNMKEVIFLMQFAFLKKHASSELDSKIFHLSPPVLEACSKMMTAACVTKRSERRTKHYHGILWHNIPTN